MDTKQNTTKNKHTSSRLTSILTNEKNTCFLLVPVVFWMSVQGRKHDGHNDCSIVTHQAHHILIIPVIQSTLSNLSKNLEINYLLKHHQVKSTLNKWSFTAKLNMGSATWTTCNKNFATLQGSDTQLSQVILQGSLTSHWCQFIVEPVSEWQH